MRGARCSRELRKVIPAFLTRVDRPDRGVAHGEYLAPATGRPPSSPSAAGPRRPAAPAGPVVRLVDFDPDGEARVLAHALWPAERRAARRRAQRDRRHSGPPSATRPSRAGRRPRRPAPAPGARARGDDVRLRGRLRLRRLPRPPAPPHADPPGPAARPRGSATTCPTRSPTPAPASDYAALQARCAELHDALAPGFPAEAPYAVTLAHRIRFTMTLNAREAMHLIELRSLPQGHESYRAVAQEMHRQIAEVAGPPGDRADDGVRQRERAGRRAPRGRAAPGGPQGRAVSDRRRIASGSPWEAVIGFSRAVRVGDRVLVSGTGPVWPDGSCDPSAGAQADRCLEIIATALGEAGASLADVVRTRMCWSMRPTPTPSPPPTRARSATSVRPPPWSWSAALLDPRWRVEIEAEAVVVGAAAARAATVSHERASERNRLGGMALANGLLVHGPRHWAAAVRDGDGRVVVASGRKRLFRAGRVTDLPSPRPGAAGRGVRRAAGGAARAARGALRDGGPPNPRHRHRRDRGRRDRAAAPALRAGPGGRRGRRGAGAGHAHAARVEARPIWHAVEHKSIAAYEAGGGVVNHGANVTVEHGMRVAQLVLAPVARIAWREAPALAESARGAGGFGSTGTGA